MEKQKENGDSPESVASRARAGLLWLGSTNAVWQVFSWVITVLTARLLAPSDYGIVAMVESVAPYLALIAALNIQTWIVQADALREEDESAVLILTASFGLIISFIAYLSAPFLASFYETPELELPFKLLSFTFFLRGIYVVPESLLRRELRFKPIALTKFGVGVFRSSAQLALAYAGLGYWALVIGMLIREVGWLICFVRIRGLPTRLRWDADVAKKALAFGIPATGAHIFWIIFSTADEVVIGKMFGAETLGLYALAFLLIDMPLAKINDIVRPVIIPYFSRIKGSPRDLEDGFLKTVRGVCAVVFPALLGLALVAPDFVPLVLGEHWTPMIVPLQVLCVIGLFRAFIDNAPPLLLALGLPKKELLIHAFSAALFPALFVTFGYYFGLYGVLFGWLAGLPILSIFILKILSSHVGISARRYISNLKIPVICTGSMLAFAWATSLALSETSPLIRLLGVISVGLASYAATMWFLYRDELMEFFRKKESIPV